MKQTERTASSALGLDVGTSRIVLAKRAGQGFQYESHLNAFVNIPFSKFTQSALQKENIPHVIQGSEIVVHGNESEKFAGLLNVETRRPMDRGFLNPQEPDSLERITQIIRIAANGSGEGQQIHFTVPAAPLGEQDSLTFHEAALRQILTDLGFKAKPITEGLAVVYAELEDTNYTGIGVSCGGGLCNVCLAYLSVPIFSFSIPKAGDFIDTSAASVIGELATSIRIAKEESFHFNGHFADKTHQVLSVYYDDMIRTLASGLRDQLARCRNLPKLGRPVPLVLSGGSALPGGFRDRFEAILQESDSPIALSEIRLAESPLHSTAKGALVSAMIDQ